jgi:signal transduction histidine kinase
MDAVDVNRSRRLHDSLLAPVRRVELPRTSQLVPLAALALGVGLTIASYETSWVHLAYHLPRIHAVIDTTIGLVSLLLAHLVYSRVQVLHRYRDVVLAFALGFSGLVNLLAAITQGVASSPLGRAAVWSTMIGRFCVAVLFAVAALTPDLRMERPMAAPRFLFRLGAGFACVIGGVYLVSSRLPWSIALANSPTDATKPLFVGPSLLLVAQALVAVCYSVAAFAFTRHHGERDDLMTWLASSCVLFALASVDYLAFPSIFSDWIYVGDLLRLAGTLLLFVGAVREISRYGREIIATQERRRVAHDLHDGVAQELAFIATLARRVETDPTSSEVRRLADAAQHALDESRLVIAALAGAGDASEQIALTARDAARRFQLAVVVRVPPVLELPSETTEVLLRIVREAVTNAGRHADASTVWISVTADADIVLEVRDDGRGFCASDPSGFGMSGMRERAESIGGAFSVTSGAGAGTTIRVKLP